jgi:hypothetical protein
LEGEDVSRVSPFKAPDVMLTYPSYHSR